MTADGVRILETAALVADAADIGMGQPRGSAHRTALLCAELSGGLGWEADGCAECLYVSLLRWAGCTSHGSMFGLFFDDEIAVHADSVTMDFASLDPIKFIARHAGAGRGPMGRAKTLVRAGMAGPSFTSQIFTASCEVAQQVALELGLPTAIGRALRAVFERWDSRGFPGHCGGSEIPASARLAAVVHEWTAFERRSGREVADAAIVSRSGRGLDPDLVSAFIESRPDDRVDSVLDNADGLEVLLDCEPGERPVATGSAVDAQLGAMAAFADLKVPFTVGQTREVARSVALVAERSGDTDPTIGWAALLSSLGRVGVPNGVWERRKPLRRGDWDQIRQYPSITRRLLEHTAFDGLAGPASDVQERLDGSGYPRAVSGNESSFNSRLLAAAIVASALQRSRPHRPALGPGEVASVLRDEVRDGRLDRRAVAAVLDVLGLPTPVRQEGPDGLTEREIEVLALLAVGRSKKQIGAELYVSPHTVDSHVRHIYDKIGVTTRAAAAVYAMRSGLVDGVNA